MSLLEVTNVKKIYTTRFGGNKVQALANVNFSVEKGEFIAIMGESGYGKTTFLNILATLDKPTSGEVLLVSLTVIPKEEYEQVSGTEISLELEFDIYLNGTEQEKESTAGKLRHEIMRMHDFCASRSVLL